MCDLWLPSKTASIRHQCSREVIGYISTSYFRYTDGKVCATGYLTCQGLRALMDVFRKFKNLKPFALTRATNSKNYFNANFHVNF
jgi:ribonuclease P/MRP protein subunit POP1